MRSIRFFTLLLVLVLVAAACSSDNGDTTATVAATDTATTVEETTTAVPPAQFGTGLLSGYDPAAVEGIGIDPYIPDDLEQFLGLSRCEWTLNSSASSLQSECDQLISVQDAAGRHDELVSLTGINPGSAGGFVGQDPVAVVREDANHACFINEIQIVALGNIELVSGFVPEAVLVEEEEGLPGGLSVYTVDDPIAASQTLLGVGIPASPRYSLVPSPRWQFGPGGVALPADPNIVAAQGTFPEPSSGSVTIIDTGFARNELEGLSPMVRNHGEFIAGIVNRLTPTSSVSLRSALTSNGSAQGGAPAPQMLTEHSVIQQLDEAMQNELDGQGGVVNLSLGTYACTADQIPLELATRIAEIAGGSADVVFVAAAGNDAHNMSEEPFWPAALSDPAFLQVVVSNLETARTAWESANGGADWHDAIDPNNVIVDFIDGMDVLMDQRIVVGVGALVSGAQGWEPAAFSNQVAATVWAPGANIVSDYVEPSWAGVAQWDGTSFAAPHISALIAGCRAALSYREALSQLFDPTSQFMTQTSCGSVP